MHATLTILGCLLAIAGIYSGRVPVGVALAGSGAWAVTLLGISSGPVGLGSWLNSEVSDLVLLVLEVVCLSASNFLLIESGVPQKLTLLACERLGHVGIRWRFPLGVSLTIALIVVSMPLGASLSTVGAIMLMVPLARMVCALVDIPSLPLSCGMLAAVSLGGYSVGSSDPANFAEREIWGLPLQHYLHGLPVNFGALLVIGGMTILFSPAYVSSFSEIRERRVLEMFAEWRLNRRIDVRNAFVGFSALFLTVVGERILHFDRWMITAGALLIVVVGSRVEHSTRALESIGFDTLLAITGAFVFASAISHPAMGLTAILKLVFQSAQHDVAAVMSVSFGVTVLTESTTGMLLVAKICAQAVPADVAAHAVGAGVLAGTVALTTASSAGIVLMHQTRADSPATRVTFRKYLAYGLPMSAALMAYYMVVTRIAG